MGVYESSLRLTQTPWRKPSVWNKELERSLKDDICRLTPPHKPNILLVGTVGSGKSSFINAAISIANGRKIERAQAGVGTTSYTTSYDKYTDESELLNHFRFRDCIGIEQAPDEGLHADNVVYLLKGHIKKSYKFKRDGPIDALSPHYRENPAFEHQTHCVVFVLNANTIYQVDLSPQFICKIEHLQKQIKELHIPREVLLTHTDHLCPEVERDVKNMFRSIKVRDAVKKTSELFKIPPCSIHPIKNYHEEIELETDMNIPLLLALRQIMTNADDRCRSGEQSDSD